MMKLMPVLMTGVFLASPVLAAPLKTQEAASKGARSAFEQKARSLDPLESALAVPTVIGICAEPKAPKAASTSDRGIRFDVRDWKACLDWMSMDIDVLVEGERFEFRPSCGFSFDKRFKTKKGKSCQVRAGMCSSFSPENAFEVTCDGGLRGKIGIPCKDSGDYGVTIEPDWESCVDGWSSMSVRISVEGEDFEFHPSCDWSFSERFETKAGGTCYAESGMCSGWHPENRFEVTCDKGQEGFATIPCRSD